MTRQGHWEIDRSHDGLFFARFKAPNGPKIMTSETYKRKRDALRAIALIEEAYVYLGYSGSRFLRSELPEVRDLTKDA